MRLVERALARYMAGTINVTRTRGEGHHGQKSIYANIIKKNSNKKFKRKNQTKKIKQEQKQKKKEQEQNKGKNNDKNISRTQKKT